MIRHHLYEQTLPTISSSETEFVRLVYYLELVTEGMDLNCFNAAVALQWQNEEVATAVPELWCNQFKDFISRSQITARSLIIDQHISWQTPKLLSLPKEYEKIFSVSINCLIK